MKKFARLIRLPADRRRRACVKLMARVFREEAGGEVIEYALVAGLIVVGAIASIACVGGKITGRWTSIRDSL